MKNKLVSIIIVNYHVRQEVFDCIESILKWKPKTSFEIIVVDNDENKILEVNLKKKFPNTIYIPNKNKGFGEANNVGAKNAQGKYLFFLNPDTKLLSNCVDQLSSYLGKNKRVGIVAPFLYRNSSMPFPLQGTKTLTPKRAVFAFSFLSRFLKNSEVTKSFWMEKVYGNEKKVEAVPGSAFMMRNKLFKNIGGFDEKIFMYFEENDLCKRVVDRKEKIVMLKNAKVFHQLGTSANKSERDLKKVFDQSRFYYLKKHFGFMNAFFAECLLIVNKYFVGLSIIGFVDVLLRILFIPQRTVFIGDQAWFYLSARDMLLSGNIPLVGITSSHTWLHQGALWTYILAIPLWIFNFNPIAGVYLSILISLATICMFYFVGKEVVSRNVGLISALTYAISPYFVIHDRMPYHTTPIPFFVLLLMLSTTKVVKGSANFLPLVFFSVAALYNLELATVIFMPVIIGIFVYGFFKKKKWFTQLKSPKMLFISVICFLLPMVPILIYDTSHGFPQTLKYGGWFIYKLLQFAGILKKTEIENSFSSVFNFLIQSSSSLIFIVSRYITIIFLCAAIYVGVRSLVQRKNSSLIIVSNLTFISLIGYFLAKTPSDAYLPMIFPGILILFSVFLSSVLKSAKYIFWVLILFMITTNLYVIFSSYLLNNRNLSFDYQRRLEITKKILKQSGNSSYNLVIVGPGSKFTSTSMNYEYLAWWLGSNPPSKQKQAIKFIINEASFEVSKIK